MGKNLIPLIVALTLSIFSFFPQQLGLLAGEMGVYTGTINFECTEGPIENIVFQLEGALGDTLMVYREPDGWDYVHHGNRIELQNGSLPRNQSITLIMSCKWYMWKGSYGFSTNATTKTGTFHIGAGKMEFPDMMALQILFHLSNPIVRVFVWGATLILLVLEIRSRQSTSAAPASDPGQDPYVV